MRSLRLEVVPMRDCTRWRVEDLQQQRVAGGRLSPSPAHPLALLNLAEALRLWWGRPLCVALSVGGPGVFCGTSRWDRTLQEVVGATDCVAAEEVLDTPGVQGLRSVLLWEVKP